jgi:lysophospholipase L1-like esterase
LRGQRARSVLVLLVTTPTYHTYYDNLDAGQLGEMYSIIDSLKQQYHLEYYDYLKDTRFVADDFWDGDHLSDLGAAKFTKILNEDIR